MKPYRPLGARDHESFYATWCDRCTEDAVLECQIVGRTMFLDDDDPDYPTEWVYGDDGKPCCTAFRAID